MERPKEWAVGQRWAISPESDTRWQIIALDPVRYRFEDGEWNLEGPANTEGDATPVSVFHFCGYAPGYGPPTESLTSSATENSLGSSAVPWPTPTVGSKWDRYVNGVAKPGEGVTVQYVSDDEVHVGGSSFFYLSKFKPGGVVGIEYIPHGWDYATKQPKAHQRTW